MNIRLTLLDFDDIRNPLLAAGQARATVEVGRRLAQMGYVITVLSSRYPGFKDRVEFGMNYRHIGLGSPFIRLNNLFYFFAIPFNVWRARADIIVECFTPPISTLLSPIFTRIPVVAIPTMFSAKDYSRKYHFPFHLIERYGCRLYKYFLPYTREIEDRMRRYNPAVISALAPNGVGDEYFRIKRQRSRYILFLGRFDMAQKGIDLLIRAYARVAGSIRYPLRIAGHGPDQERIYELIKKLHMEKYITVVGPLYGRKKLSALSEAVVIAFPSRHDDFPVFSLEALASGNPLVTFDIHEFSIFGKDISYKAHAFDIEEYARMLMHAVYDKHLVHKRLLCRRFAGRYTWDKTAAAYNRFFRRIHRGDFL